MRISLGRKTITKPIEYQWLMKRNIDCFKRISELEKFNENDNFDDFVFSESDDSQGEEDTIKP